MTKEENTKSKEPNAQEVSGDCLDRAYKGRHGWGGGALWDSIKYTAHLIRGAVSRRLARRKVIKKLEEREELFDQRLEELGRFALYLDGFDHEIIREFDDELKKLEAREAGLEEQIRDVEQRYQSAKVEAARIIRELEDKYRDARTGRRDVEEEVDPLIAEHRSLRSKLQRYEWEIEHLDEKVRLGDSDLNRLSREGAPVAEVSKLRTKVSKWKSEIKKIERNIPEVRSHIQSIKPQIVELKDKLEESRKVEEAAKAELREATAHEKTRQEGLVTEKEGLEHALSEVEKFKARVFFESGQTLNWNRLENPALEGRYGELDAIEKDKKRLTAKASLLNKPKGKIAWEPLFRTIALFTAFTLIVLIILKVTVF